MRKHIDELLMIIVALIFGFSYSAQSIGAKYVAPFSFSAIKNIISFIALFVIFLFRRNKSPNLKKAIIFGFIIAIDLTVFSYLQQVVALENTPGKTGFITISTVIIKFFNFYKIARRN